MDPVFVALYAISNTIFLIVAIILTFRSLQSKNYYVLLLALAYLTRFILGIGSELEQKYLLRGLLDFDDAPLILLFTKYAYHQRQKTHFPSLFMSTFALRVFVGIIVVAFQFDIPTTRALVGLDLAVYFVYLTAGVVMMFIGYGWFVQSAWSASKRSSEGVALPSWVRFRNKVAAIAFSVVIAGSFLWYLLPTDGSGFGIISGGSPGSVLVAIYAFPAFFYLIFNTIAWITPKFIIARFNKQAELSINARKEILSGISDSDKLRDSAAMERILNQRGIVELVNYLGDYLAPIIGKSPSAVKGLLFISIGSELGEEAIYVMKLKQIINVINGALKTRLGAMGIGNLEMIVGKLTKKIVDEQSMLMMMSI